MLETSAWLYLKLAVGPANSTCSPLQIAHRFLGERVPVSCPRSESGAA